MNGNSAFSSSYWAIFPIGFVKSYKFSFLDYGIVVVHSFFTTSRQLGQHSGLVLTYSSSVAQHLTHFCMWRNCALSLCKVDWKLGLIREKQNHQELGFADCCCRQRSSLLQVTAQHTSKATQGKKKTVAEWSKLKRWG